MVESAGLLNRCRGNTLPQVRILSSPLDSARRAAPVARRFLSVAEPKKHGKTGRGDVQPAVATNPIYG